MYRKQMTLQRILCILMVVVSAVVFVYALGFMTDANDMIATAALGYEAPTGTSAEVKAEIAAKKAPMRQFMDDMNLFDSTFVKVGIGLILVSLTLLLTNTHTRRKYYISNYIATLLTVGAACAVSVWAHGEIAGLRARYFSGEIDFDFVKMACDDLARGNGSVQSVNVYTESAFWFDVHYYVFGILLLMAAFLILNAIWKSILMKREKNALAMGKAVS